MIPDKYDNRTLKEMFGGKKVSPIMPYESLEADRQTISASIQACGRVSVSGVQPKYAMVVENGLLRFARENEQGRYILKTVPVERHIADRQWVPVNECLTMHIAQEIFGISTAKNCLCFFKNGEIAYLTKRFDVKEDGSKFLQEDFASIAGISRLTHGDDYKYSVLSYADCAKLIIKYVSAATVELMKFFRIVLFNYIMSNDDAHLKNFSLMSKDGKDYRLTPAYDMLNTFIHLSNPTIFALSKGLYDGMKIDDTNAVTRQSFLSFGVQIGLPEKLIEKEINTFAESKNKIKEMVDRSMLPDNLKNLYLQTYEYRCHTLKE